MLGLDCISDLDQPSKYSQRCYHICFATTYIVEDTSGPIKKGWRYNDILSGINVRYPSHPLFLLLQARVVNIAHVVESLGAASDLPSMLRELTSIINGQMRRQVCFPRLLKKRC